MKNEKPLYEITVARDDGDDLIYCFVDQEKVNQVLVKFPKARVAIYELSENKNNNLLSQN